MPFAFTSTTALLALLLVGCPGWWEDESDWDDEGCDADDTAPWKCEEGEPVPLATLDLSEWPGDLASMVAAHSAMTGTWQVDVECNQGPEYAEPAQLIVGACGPEDIDLYPIVEDCCTPGHLARCSTSGLIFTGWKPYEYFGFAASVFNVTPDDHGMFFIDSLGGDPFPYCYVAGDGQGWVNGGVILTEPKELNCHFSNVVRLD